MRFNITMNLPTRARQGQMPNPVHGVICDAPFESLEDFCDALNSEAFLVVDEFYKDGNQVYNHGRLIINTSLVAKVKEWVPA